MTEQREYALMEKIVRIRDNAKRMIWVTFQREGIHAYLEAGHLEHLQDVDFLRYPHRHMFHFKVAIEVKHSNRDIEFIQFKRWLESLYQGTLVLNAKSCEMICDELYEMIASRYPNRDVEITLSEDDENGATVYYNQNRPYQQLAN